MILRGNWYLLEWERKISSKLSIWDRSSVRSSKIDQCHRVENHQIDMWVTFWTKKWSIWVRLQFWTPSPNKWRRNAKNNNWNKTKSASIFLTPTKPQTNLQISSTKTQEWRWASRSLIYKTENLLEQLTKIWMIARDWHWHSSRIEPRERSSIRVRKIWGWEKTRRSIGGPREMSLLNEGRKAWIKLR